MVTESFQLHSLFEYTLLVNIASAAILAKDLLSFSAIIVTTVEAQLIRRQVCVCKGTRVGLPLSTSLNVRIVCMKSSHCFPIPHIDVLLYIAHFAWQPPQSLTFVYHSTSETKTYLWQPQSIRFVYYSRCCILR